ncbi:MAG: hypothetical protein R6V46_17410 [Desulfatiglandaceae bacterium]
MLAHPSLLLKQIFTHFGLEPFWVKIRQGQARIKASRSLVSPGTEHMLMDFDRKNVVANAVAPPSAFGQSAFYPFRP